MLQVVENQAAAVQIYSGQHASAGETVAAAEAEAS